MVRNFVQSGSQRFKAAVQRSLMAFFICERSKLVCRSGQMKKASRLRRDGRFKDLGKHLAGVFGSPQAIRKSFGLKRVRKRRLTQYVI
jgi:hypothetical protein